jgi:hypothetical protein
MSLSTVSSPINAATPTAFRYLTARGRGIHRLLKAVRSTYRAQHRKPQLEPVFVDWIEQFVRFFPTDPVGTLGRAHVRTFLAHLATRPDGTPEQREQARTALRFLRVEVLNQV